MDMQNNETHVRKKHVMLHHASVSCQIVTTASPLCCFPMRSAGQLQVSVCQKASEKRESSRKATAMQAVVPLQGGWEKTGDF